jgi:hypothetical protein
MFHLPVLGCKGGKTSWKLKKSYETRLDISKSWRTSEPCLSLPKAHLKSYRSIPSRAAEKDPGRRGTQISLRTSPRHINLFFHGSNLPPSSRLHTAQCQPVGLTNLLLFKVKHNQTMSLLKHKDIHKDAHPLLRDGYLVAGC